MNNSPEDLVRLQNRNRGRLHREERDYRVARILDELQASVVLVGGAKISIDRLKLMRVEDLLNICCNNGINIVFRPDPEKLQCR